MRDIAAHISVILTAGLTLSACWLIARQVANGRRSGTSNDVDTGATRAQVAIFFTAAIAISIAPIFGYWYSGNSTDVALGGFFPWNDGAGYFSCANTILDSGPLGSFCQRRPIYNLLLATWMAISGRDLQIVLLLQGAFFGGAAFVLARMVHSQLNAPAALMSFAVLLGMAGHYGIATMTENAGLLYGIFGAYFLWRGAEKGRGTEIVVGAFLLTLGLNARAGAFLMLPALLIWTAVAADEQRRVRIAITLAATAAIFGGFLFNHAASVSFGGDPGLAHSNFSVVLYGVAAGGESWTQVYTDHPEIFSLGGGHAAETGRVYGAALDNVLQRPQLFLWGYVRGIAHFVYKQFQYLGLPPVRLLFLGLWWLGLIATFRGRHDRRMSLLFAMALGIVVSAPFITWSGGNRIYAASLPVDALLVAVGAFAVQGFLLRRFAGIELTHSVQRLPHRIMNLMAAILVVATLPGPHVLRAWTALSPVSGQSCKEGQMPVVIRMGLETLFFKIAAPDATSLFPLNLPADGFRKRVVGAAHLGSALARLPVGTVLLRAFQLHEPDFGARYLLVWENGTPPAKGTIMRFCISDEHHDDIPDFFVVKSAQALVN